MKYMKMRNLYLVCVSIHKLNILNKNVFKKYFKVNIKKCLY